jgi:hypothetical protein
VAKTWEYDAAGRPVHKRDQSRKVETVMKLMPMIQGWQAYIRRISLFFSLKFEYMPARFVDRQCVGEIFSGTIQSTVAFSLDSPLFCRGEKDSFN